MHSRPLKRAFETRIRTVLLFVLLASLVIQAGTVVLVDFSADALEGDLVSPLYTALDELTAVPPDAAGVTEGYWRRARGLEVRQQFFLRDTIFPGAAAHWQQLPPSARRKMLSGETVRIRREEEGAFALALWRLEGSGDETRVLSAGRALPAYGKFLALGRWNALFRSAGLLLLLGAVFLVTRELTRPFHRLQKVALDAQESLHLESAPSHEEWEDVIATFTATIDRLKESQQRLEKRYVSSEEERLRLEALVSQRARMAALGETAAGLAHELRNAMGAIVGYARLVTRTDGDGTAEIARRIECEAAEMESMLARFLEVARPAALCRAPTNAPGIVREVVDRFSARFREAGIRLESDLPEAGTLELDSVWFKQAVANLLENALQHVPRGGHVWISSASPRDSWWLEVADDGPGIAPEWRTRVLAPFVSLRPGGTGLGLALVQKVMTAHDGRVEIGASAAGGVKVTLTLPCAPTKRTEMLRAF